VNSFPVGSLTTRKEEELLAYDVKAVSSPDHGKIWKTGEGDAVKSSLHTDKNGFKK
jgi:hypothetical protein